MKILKREGGFTIPELMISTTILLVLTGAALSTFQNALMVNDSASQLADANQNLRAGMNQLIKDVMQAGRIIGPEGIPIPNGAGAQLIQRPSPPNTTMNFNTTTTTNLPDITTGYTLGPVINGVATDMLTLMTVDAFMPTVETPPTGTVDPNEGTLASDGGSITLPANSVWLTGDPVNDTPAMNVGDLVLFKNTRGMAIQTVTRKDATHLFFDPNDWFHFNQRGAPAGTIMQIKDVNDNVTPWSEKTTLFRVMMITYYVDNTTTAQRAAAGAAGQRLHAAGAGRRRRGHRPDLRPGRRHQQPGGDSVAAVYRQYPESPGHLQLESDPEGQHPRRRAVRADRAPDPGLRPESHFDFG